jgi:protein O-mannosyl-transferase
MSQKRAVNIKTDAVKPAKNSPGNWSLYLLAGAIAVITFISFSPALKNSFTNWDDNAYVFENPNLGKPLSEAIVYFFEPHYFIGNYIPLTMITYALEFHAADLDPQLFHTVNVLIHLLNVLLVFWFIYLLSGKKLLVAAFVALFFGIHPMHVESVAWIAELKDMLYSFFFLAGLITYFKYIEEKFSIANTKPGEQDSLHKQSPVRLYVFTLIFFICSLLSKPAAMVFPLVLLLLDFYTRRKPGKVAWIEKVPFFVLSLVFGIIAIKAQKADGLIHDYYPFSQRLFFAAHTLLNYLVKLFLPVNLSIFYPYPTLVDGHLPVVFYVAPVILVALCYGIYRTLKFTRLVAFGFLFFFINLILVLQLLSIGDAIMADRYSYIPYIGLFFMMAMGFDHLYNTTGQKLKIWRQAVIAVVIVFAVTCSYLTYARCQVWESDDTIATDLLNKFPDDRLALNNKGFILLNQKRYSEAIELFTKAIQIKPDYLMAYINLINTYMSQRDYDNALKTTTAALQFAPKNFNLLNTKGYILFTEHQYTDAVKFYSEAIAVNGNNIYTYINLAQCYYQLQDYENSIKIIDQGLAHDPSNYMLLNNKGYNLFVMHKYTEAVECYKASLQNKPDYTTASVNLADCYKAMADSSRK